MSGPLLHMLIGQRMHILSETKVGLNSPSGQSLHSPSWRTCLPGQASQMNMPSLDGSPVGQERHEIAPSSGWNVLEGQLWHWGPVIPVENVPAGHGTHWTYESVSWELNWASTW